ncbi:hypothetical protein HDA32_001812 [Spinactinospora alkalitolerans]|uniref:Uncharacterized protein n=1 Tax=Spinactinospora alkalitolerans TaxID=687207 RepID=A0A852TUZ2_9ACTN|nr:hypothetical protein [Spinactinospora alkalitolerans]NYE46692.1 hypothetical protein [Spinactinospora alkalitolerans]
MPCYLCGARQNDPVRGTHPWKRGVRHERQVLICPDCQLTQDWKADLDRCGRCRSTFLLSRLGEIECHSCGEVRPQTSPQPVPSSAHLDAVLTNEVEQALSRVLGGLSRLPGPRRAHR